MVDTNFRNLRGQKSGTTKLQEHEAQAILDATPADKTDMMLAKQLAAKYRIGFRTVQGIWRRRSWTHLKRKSTEQHEVQQ